MGANEGMCVYMFIYAHIHEAGREGCDRRENCFLLFMSNRTVVSRLLGGVCVCVEEGACGCVVVRVCVRTRVGVRVCNASCALSSRECFLFSMECVLSSTRICLGLNTPSLSHTEGMWGQQAGCTCVAMGAGGGAPPRMSSEAVFT